jgi:hypothetical protein
VRFGKILADVGAVGADALDSSMVCQDANANTLRDGSSQAQNNNWFVGWSNDTVNKNASETKTVLQRRASPVNYNAKYAKTVSAGSGIDWFFYKPPTTSNKKPRDFRTSH